MATNFYKIGDTLTLVAPANVKSGEAFLVGSIFAVAAYDALQTETVEGHTVGVWSLPKAGTPLTFAAGAKVFWDNSAKTCKATSAGFYCIGAAVAAAGATDTHVLVRLDGRAVTAV